jgi:hypothetical protein
MHRFCFLFLLSILSSSCNDYQKLLNSPDNEVDKYTALKVTMIMENLEELML